MTSAFQQTWDDFASHMDWHNRTYDGQGGHTDGMIEKSEFRIDGTQYSLILTNRELKKAHKTVIYPCVLKRSGHLPFIVPMYVRVIQYKKNSAIWSSNCVVSIKPADHVDPHADVTPWNEDAADAIVRIYWKDHQIYGVMGAGKNVRHRYTAFDSLARLIKHRPFYGMRGSFSHFRRHLEKTDECLVKLAVHPNRDSILQIWEECYRPKCVTQMQFDLRQTCMNMMIKAIEV